MTYRLIKEFPFEGSPKVGYVSKPLNRTTKDNVHYWNHNWYYPEKYPEYWQPRLFVTEDNIDVFEGDEYWVLTPNTKTLIHSIADEESLYCTGLTFSTVEAATQYLDREIPIFTKSDIHSALAVSLDYEHTTKDIINRTKFWEILNSKKQ